MVSVELRESNDCLPAAAWWKFACEGRAWHKLLKKTLAPPSTVILVVPDISYVEYLMSSITYVRRT
jgi:hypothetical protein